MTDLPGVDVLLGWVHDGQRRLEQVVAGLDDDAGRAPSALPGWTRGHVLTHLARNSDALVNLLDWARTGTPTPMYASPDQRNADIEAGAGRALAEHAADLCAAGERFATAAAALPVAAWSARVRSAQGRDIAAAEVPWMRTREVWIHVVDLDVGMGVEVLPEDLSLVLIRDVAAWMSAKADAAVLLRPDGAQDVLLGVPGAPPAAAVSGPANRIAGWLVGRASTVELRCDGAVPTLPRWL